jgi:hypothetical protein
MPIITEPYSNPRWGFLNGLGAAPTDILSGSDLSAFQQQVSNLNIKVGQLIADIDSKRSWAITGTQQGFFNTMETTKQTLSQWYSVGYEITSSGTIDGGSITREQASRYLDLGGRLAQSYAEAARAISDYSPTAILKNAVLQTAGDLIETANDLFSAARGVISGAAGVAGLTKYLPWIVVGGFIAFYIVPTIIRTKREGAAGLEAELRAGRSRVEEGARSAGKLVVKAGKAGAAAYTGNPALLGSPKRRTRR